MRVSVVLPTRDRRELLREALESALARTGPEDEILVVDDGSRDGTAEDLRATPERVRVLTTPGVGPSGARNRAIEAARGRFVAFLDSDDVWLPVGLDEQVAALEADPAPGLSHARARPVDAAGRPLPSRPRPPLAGDALRALLEKNPITTSTVVVPRAALDRVGLFDEELDHSMDRDLWIRIAESLEFHHLPVEVCRYRFHEKQQISDRRAVDRARCRIYEKALARYREGRPELAPMVLKLLARRRLRLGRLCLLAGDRDAAEASFAAAIRLRPVAARLTAFRYRRTAR